MKLMILIIIGLTIWPVPLVGNMVRNLLGIIVLCQGIMHAPMFLRGLITPRRMM